MKVRSNRGENWLLASCRVTTVSENVSDVTVISEPEMALSTVRAASAPPPKSRSELPRPTCASSWGSSRPRTSAARTASAGMGHSFVRKPSRSRSAVMFTPSD